MTTMNRNRVKVFAGGGIEIVSKHGQYGFHPLDLAVEDRLKMIHALSITVKEYMEEHNK